jgi:hypothetical protein
MANRVATAEGVATDNASVLFPEAQSEISAFAAWSALGCGADGTATVVVVVVLVVGADLSVEWAVADEFDFGEAEGPPEHAARMVPQARAVTTRTASRVRVR